MTQTELATYLEFSPYYVYSENETPLQEKQKTENYFALPLNLRVVCIIPETSGTIKDIAMNRYSLSFEQTQKLSYLMRLVFFGELAISDFIDRIKSELKIDRDIAQKIALDINREIFRKAATELKEIQKKFQQKNAAPGIMPRAKIEQPRPTPTAEIPSTPPKELPILKEEYEETSDSYLEPVTEEDRIRRSNAKANKRPNPLIEGNIVNLKSHNS